MYSKISFKPAVAKVLVIALLGVSVGVWLNIQGTEIENSSEMFGICWGILSSLYAICSRWLYGVSPNNKVGAVRTIYWFSVVCSFFVLALLLKDILPVYLWINYSTLLLAYSSWVAVFLLVEFSIVDYFDGLANG